MIVSALLHNIILFFPIVLCVFFKKYYWLILDFLLIIRVWFASLLECQVKSTIFCINIHWSLLESLFVHFLRLQSFKHNLSIISGLALDFVICSLLVLLFRKFQYFAFSYCERSNWRFRWAVCGNKLNPYPVEQVVIFKPLF